MSNFKIHPSIGIARLGNSDDFYLTPEQPGALPIECDSTGAEITTEDGKPKRVTEFKDSDDLSRIKRQAARFRVFAYKDENDKDGEEIRIGGEYEFIYQTNVTALKKVKGTVVDIKWTVHLANKKSSWYDFQETDGRRGYSPTHPLRNPEITQPDSRRQLIIDPGPQSVSGKGPITASFKKGENPGYPQNFPPDDIKPHPIDTLGELKVTREGEGNSLQRLIVLGGKGRSGTTEEIPVITSFVNNHGWFDDTSDGPVTATIAYEFEDELWDGDKKTIQKVTGTMDVQDPAWVIVGYPRYVPQIQDMINLDEALYDLFVREMAYGPEIYGIPPFDRSINRPQTAEERLNWRNEARFNPGYYPKFYKEIWPILKRPDEYKWIFDFDPFEGGDPHNTGTGGNIDQRALSRPPERGEDPNLRLRQFIYSILRQSEQVNDFVQSKSSSPGNQRRLMPMLCGNNPISNTAPEKFLALTETQLFLLKQWADGKFVNECIEWNQNPETCQDPWAEPPVTGTGIDRGVLSNGLGGAFCPGGEVSWIIVNPAVYNKPYRIKHADYLAGALSLPQPIASQDGSQAADISAGMEPGDLTKYTGVPWQADFHECSYQPIDVTYREWNEIYLDSTGDPAVDEIAYNIPWWPAHRPLVVNGDIGGGKTGQVYWASGIPPNNAGDLEMVDAWKDLGFIRKHGKGEGVEFLQQERNNAAVGPPVQPGDRVLGQTTNVKKTRT